MESVRNGRHWTKEERTFLVLRWQEYSDAELASHLKRGIPAIRTQRQDMGLYRDEERMRGAGPDPEQRSRKCWKDSEDQALRIMRDADWSNPRIATALRRSRKAITARINDLGLPHRVDSNGRLEFSKEEESDLNLDARQIKAWEFYLLFRKIADHIDKGSPIEDLWIEADDKLCQAWGIAPF